LPEVRDIEDLPVADARIVRHRLAGLAPDAGRCLERSVEARERDLPLVVERLVGQHAHRVLVHRALDRPLQVIVHPLAEVDPGDPRGEQRLDPCDAKLHVRLPGGFVGSVPRIALS
jgi:hypothetical protein